MATPRGGINIPAAFAHLGSWVLVFAAIGWLCAVIVGDIKSREAAPPVCEDPDCLGCRGPLRKGFDPQDPDAQQVIREARERAARRRSGK